MSARVYFLVIPLVLSLQAARAAEPPPLDAPQVGGANSPVPSPPHPLTITKTAELDCGTFRVKVPAGSYTAPKGGAPDYGVPGPIVAFKGPDGVWRGHGYLETFPKLLSFEGTVEDKTARLEYRFEGDKRYSVTLEATPGALLMDEAADLGPRNLFVFDAYYGWLPAAGFATNVAGTHHNFLYLPCYYDKPEVDVNPVAQARAEERKEEERTKPEDLPGGVAVTSADPATQDVAGFWCRAVDSWQGGDTMGFALWQHRQLPGDPSSRHFLGPETKSDSTPNPRTAGMLGPSLYEGHVTIEFALGTGTRKLGFAATTKGPAKPNLPNAFEKTVRATR